jgi:EpsI family protein
VIARRDIIFGAAGLAALGAAEALRPRKRLVLLKGGGTIEVAIPKRFGPWQAEASTGLVSPEMAGKLAKSLYSETVSRTYFHDATGASVMLLAAYGDTQSDLLQLHRPETCYPAVGFAIASTQASELPLAAGTLLPVRRVVAATEERTENIVYWTRLGERLPQSGGEQREARLANAMQGFVADGILVRASVLGETGPAFATLSDFLPQMLKATRKDLRPALIGTSLSQRLG